MSATIFYSDTNELATLTNTFSVAGTPTDPTTTTLTVTTPSGVATDYTSFTHTPASGVYAKDIACTEAGEWVAKWVGTGAASDVVEVRWTVYPTGATLYCSVESVKSRLGITSTDTTDDQEIRSAVGAVSAWVDEHCGDFFGRVTDTRTFEAPCGRDLWTGSLVSVTSIKSDPAGDASFSTTWVPADYQLLPTNRNTGRETRPYTSIRTIGSQAWPYGYSGRADRLQIVGVWGWPAVPAPVREAALILSVDHFALKDTKFGAAGFGAEGFLVRVKQNPQALELLAPYCYMTVA